MPTLGHVPHGQCCARITEFQKLGGMKSNKTEKEVQGIISLTAVCLGTTRRAEQSCEAVVGVLQIVF